MVADGKVSGMTSPPVSSGCTTDLDSPHTDELNVVKVSTSQLGSEV